MNQENHDNFDTPRNILMKRKRGRPRKEKCRNPAVIHWKHEENACVPPGCQVVNDDKNDVVLGQAVTGFIEAIFDAGYLISVTVDGSDIPFRGVVFKPGCYVPISEENDVAPEVPIIRRHHISHPTENCTSVHGNNLSTSGTANQVPKAANLSSSKRKKRVPTMESQPSWPAASTGIMVPVRLKSVDLSNVLPMANEVPPVATTQAAAQIAAAKGRQVPVATLQSVNQLLPSQPQSSNQIMIKGLQNDNDTFTRPSPGAEAKSSKVSGSPSTTLLDGGLPKMDSQFTSIHPIQTIQPDTHNEYASVDKNGTTDNTAELFQEESVDYAEDYL